MLRLASVALLALLLAAPANAQGQAAVRREEARAEVHQLLAGGSPHRALTRLQFLGEQRFAAQALISAFDPLLDEARRRQVAQVVAGLGAPKSEAFLLELASSSDPVLRMHGASGLGRIRSRRAEALEPLLQDPVMAVRREAAWALGEASVRRAFAPLSRAVRTEGEPEVRQAMLRALGRSGHPQAAGALAPFLDHSSESTRWAAGQALVHLGAPRGHAYAGELLASADRLVRRQGVALFAQVPSGRAAKFLRPMLQDPDAAVAASAARILYQGGDASMLLWLVLASQSAAAADRGAYEQELETLMLTDERRRELLHQAGRR